MAVCCSRDSFNSVKQPDVLDGDDRLIGESFEKIDLHLCERADLGATCDQYSNVFPLLKKGSSQESAPSCWRNPDLGNRLCARGSGYGAYRAPRIQRNCCGSSILISTWSIQAWFQMSGQTIALPSRSATPRHRSHKLARHSRQSHRGQAEVSGRTADDAEHLGRRRLLLQCLAQFRVTLLNSLNSRTFSIAITAWSAKVLRSVICLSEKGRTSVRRIRIAPMGAPSRSKRCRKERPSTSH